METLSSRYGLKPKARITVPPYAEMLLALDNIFDSPTIPPLVLSFVAEKIFRLENITDVRNFLAFCETFDQFPFPFALPGIKVHFTVINPHGPEVRHLNKYAGDWNDPNWHAQNEVGFALFNDSKKLAFVLFEHLSKSKMVPNITIKMHQQFALPSKIFDFLFQIMQNAATSEIKFLCTLMPSDYVKIVEMITEPNMTFDDMPNIIVSGVAIRNWKPERRSVGRYVLLSPGGFFLGYKKDGMNCRVMNLKKQHFVWDHEKADYVANHTLSKKFKFDSWIQALKDPSAEKVLEIRGPRNSVFAQEWYVFADES